MLIRISLALVVVALGASSPAIAGDPGEPAAKPARTVEVKEYQYTPNTLKIHVGQTVTWINRDLFPHTVTADQRRFDSHAIEAGGSWTFTAKKVGVTSYGCTFHPTMRGTLRVE